MKLLFPILLLMLGACAASPPEDAPDAVTYELSALVVDETFLDDDSVPDGMAECGIACGQRARVCHDNCNDCYPSDYGKFLHCAEACERARERCANDCYYWYPF